MRQRHGWLLTFALLALVLALAQVGETLVPKDKIFSDEFYTLPAVENTVRLNVRGIGEGTYQILGFWDEAPWKFEENNEGVVGYIPSRHPMIAVNGQWTAITLRIIGDTEYVVMFDNNYRYHVEEESLTNGVIVTITHY